MGHKWRVKKSAEPPTMVPKDYRPASGGRLIAGFLLLLINKERFCQWKWIDVSSQRLTRQLTFTSSVWPLDYSL